MKDISVADIIMAVDEPLDATQCGGKENCADERPCMTHELWSNLTRKMTEYLDSVSLAQLVEGQRERTAEIVPRPVSVLREHQAALEFPTSTLQSIRMDGTRVPQPT
jgi:Rrf2 family iron-sulfur cluster assembly transcriptional regulator